MWTLGADITREEYLHLQLYGTTRAELMAQVTEKLMLEQLDREQAEHGWEN